MKFEEQHRNIRKPKKMGCLYLFGLSNLLKQKCLLFTQLWITEETFTILPSMQDSDAVSTIFPNSISVNRKWPSKGKQDKKIQFPCPKLDPFYLLFVLIRVKKKSTKNTLTSDHGTHRNSCLINVKTTCLFLD